MNRHQLAKILWKRETLLLFLSCTNCLNDILADSTSSSYTLFTNSSLFTPLIFLLAIFFIDLDGFKEVNDSLGHSMGDKILLDSAIRLKSLISEYDGYVARFGGDEFIVLRGSFL